MIKYTVEVDDDGDRYWYLNDKLHREDGPAVEYASGSKFWYLNGKTHREDGPAVEYASGYRAWYLQGKKYTKKEFLKLTQPVADITVSCQEGDASEISMSKNQALEIAIGALQYVISQVQTSSDGTEATQAHIKEKLLALALLEKEVQ